MITKKVGYKRKQRVKDDVGRRTAQREMTPPCTRVRFRPPRMTHRMHQQRRPHSLRDITRACWLLQAHCAPPAPEQHAGRHRVVRKNSGQLFASGHRPRPHCHDHELSHDPQQFVARAQYSSVTFGLSAAGRPPRLGVRGLLVLSIDIDDQKHRLGWSR